jgi:hypothetical protein
MTWIFHVSAKDERKLYSRLLIVLERQMATIQIFHAEVHEGRAQITFVISSDADRACRIQSLVCRLQDVTGVSVLCG